MAQLPQAPRPAFLPIPSVFCPFISLPKSSSAHRPSYSHRVPLTSPTSYRLILPRASTTSPPDSHSLTTWLFANKAKLNEALSLIPINRRTNLGLALLDNTPPLAKGTELAVLPEKTYLTSRTARDALQQHAPRIETMSSADKLSAASWLALQLLYEWSKGAESEYEALLRMLPAAGCVDSLPLWTAEQRKWLKGCKVLEKAEEVRKGVEAEWERVKGGIIGALFGEGEAGRLEMYRWAVGVVDARGIVVGQEIVLAPVVGLLSPAIEGNARVEIVGEGFFSGKKVVKVMLEKEVKGGEEVTVGIGDGERVRNVDVLLERGVVTKDARADAVEMSFGLTSMDRFYEDKVDIIEELAEGGEREGDVMTFELEYTDRKWEPPVGMENFVRLVCLGGTDAFLLEAVFRKDIWEHMGLPVSAKNEEAVCATVIGACEDALEGYGLEEGIEVEDEEDVERLEMAKRIVEAEKKILTKVVVEYRRRQNGLDAMEYYAERRLKDLDLLRPVDESEIVDAESGGRVGRAFDENY